MNVFEQPELREGLGVFRDRAEAGELLAELLAARAVSRGTVLAVPAGGVPVAVALARRQRLRLALAVVSKITPPGNSEVGYGAVAFDGSVRLNDRLVRALGLTPREVEEGIAATSRVVARRAERFGARSLPPLGEDPAILVDDGLASGVTLRVAVEAVRRAGARSVIVAVPTGQATSLEELAGEVDAVYCGNVRSGLPFAVADAYRRWDDVDDAAVAAALQDLAAGP